MPGTVSFDYDSDANIVFTEDRWEVRTPEDVDEFLGQCERFFKSVGTKFYMVSHIDALVVHGPVADCYAERIKPMADRYVLGFARWGASPFSRMALRTTAQKAKMLANIFETRDEAVAAIERMKAAASKG